jgi:hypothetical protein
MAIGQMEILRDIPVILVKAEGKIRSVAVDADKVKEILMKVKNGEWDWEEASEALGSEQKNEQQSKGPKPMATRSDAKSKRFRRQETGGSAEPGDGHKQ